MNKIWSGEHFLLAKSGFHEKVWSHKHTSTWSPDNIDYCTQVKCSTLYIAFYQGEVK